MLQRLIASLFIVFIVVSCNNNSNTTTEGNKDTSTTAAADTTPKYGEMKKYWMVFLTKGPNRSQDSATAARIQQMHLANIDRLANEGKVIMAGPTGSKSSNIAGFLVMNCADSMEAATHIKTDTAVIAGRLKFEIIPWWTAKGKYQFD